MQQNDHHLVSVLQASLQAIHLPLHSSAILADLPLQLVHGQAHREAPRLSAARCKGRSTRVNQKGNPNKNDAFFETATSNMRRSQKMMTGTNSWTQLICLDFWWSIGRQTAKTRHWNQQPGPSPLLNSFHAKLTTQKTNQKQIVHSDLLKTPGKNKTSSPKNGLYSSWK